MTPGTPMTLPEMHRTLTPEQAAFFTAALLGSFAAVLDRSGATRSQIEAIMLQILTEAHAATQEPGAMEAWLNGDPDRPDPVFPSLDAGRPL